MLVFFLLKKSCFCSNTIMEYIKHSANSDLAFNAQNRSQQAELESWREGRRRGVADNGLGAGTVEREARRGILPRHPPVILNTGHCLKSSSTLPQASSAEGCSTSRLAADFEKSCDPMKS